MFLPVSMALHHQEPHKQPNKPTLPLQPPPATMLPWQPRRKISLKKRQKVQAVKLGGTKPRRGMLVRVVKIFRRMRVKWLKLHYIRMLKKLKEYYKNVLKQMVETGATIETMLFMESNFVIPTGLILSSCPSRYGSDRPRTISV